MKIVFINGKIASGKTTIGKKLYDLIKNSAFIDGDAFMQINPFNPTKNNYISCADSIINLIDNYIKNFNLQYIFVSWVIAYEDIYLKFKEHFNKHNLYFYYLTSTDEILKKRIKIDIKNKVRYADNIDKTYKDFFNKEHTIIISNKIDDTVKYIEGQVIKIIWKNK